MARRAGVAPAFGRQLSAPPRTARRIEKAPVTDRGPAHQPGGCRGTLPASGHGVISGPRLAAKEKSHRRGISPRLRLSRVQYSMGA